MVVKLEKRNNSRIHCIITTSETVRRLIGGHINNSSTLECLSNKDLKRNIDSEVVRVKKKDSTRINERALFTVNT